MELKSIRCSNMKKVNILNLDLLYIENERKKKIEIDEISDYKHCLVNVKRSQGNSHLTSSLTSIK